MLDAVVVRDAQGALLRANPAARALLGELVDRGLAAEQLVEQFQATSPDGRPIPPEELPELRARRGEAVGEWECLLRLPSGERQVSLSAAPLRDAAGVLRGTIAVLRDVTVSRRVERARDRFLSIASHELKTPLGPLRIAIQHLQRQIERGALQPDELTGTLERMDHQAARLANLIDDLLDISRLREGQLALRCAPLDLVALTREVVERFRTEAAATESRSQTIRLELAVETLEGHWDAQRLDQVLTNLLTNALKYSAPESTITVRLESAGGYARLSVDDQGIGVPAEDFERLFEPFHRARNAPSVYFGGLGLGLAICKGIVEHHGGRIWARSEEGRGSTFAVELPLEDPSAG
jgi:signal transduction histidine kinase